MGIKIIGTGKYLPEKVITNEDISQHVDTSHEWILDRTAKDRNDRKLAGHGGGCCGAGFAGNR